MSDMGEVKKVYIGKSFRSSKEVVKLDVIISDPRDLQTVEYLPEAGETSVPSVGDVVLIHEVASEYKVATATNTGIIVASLQEGEKAVFAVKDGAVASVIEFVKNGELVLNKGNDYAVAFSELKSGFDELKEDYNGFVNSYLAHFHNFPATGGAPTTPALVTPPVLPPANTTASVDDSKVEKVRL